MGCSGRKGARKKEEGAAVHKQARDITAAPRIACHLAKDRGRRARERDGYGDGEGDESVAVMESVLVDFDGGLDRALESTGEGTKRQRHFHSTIAEHCC